jgi:hypothetical protein
VIPAAVGVSLVGVSKAVVETDDAVAGDESKVTGMDVDVDVDVDSELVVVEVEDCDCKAFLA